MLNRQTGKLYIKKRTFPEWLAYFIVVFPFFFSLLIELLGLINWVRYIVDLAWVLASIALFFQRKIALKKGLYPFFLLTILFFVYTLVAYLFRIQSPLYYLWGVRNNFRFYFAFLVFASFFEEDDVSSLFKIMDILFWINIPICLFQFFVLGLNQDFLGGIFGTERGCNGYMLIFFSIIASKSLLCFMHKKESSLSCFLKCGFALLLATLAELKFFFVILVVILLLSSLLTKFSWKKFLLLLSLMLIASLMASIFPILFGENSNLTFEKILELITSESYSSENDMGRFTAIPIALKLFLTTPAKQLLGLGLGNCDTSAFAAFNTPFFQRYEFLHYSWFSSAFLLLETGWFGLIFYFTFFVFCFFTSRKRLKENTSNPLYCQMAMITSILCVILTFYNSSLRTEAAYMIYFVLALPFIPSKNPTNKPLNGSHFVQ